MARADEPRDTPTVLACCKVAHHRLNVRPADLEALREQQRFERICARELMGEIDG